MKNRFFPFMLCVALVVSLVVPATAISPLQLSVEPESVAVDVDDTFTVEIAIQGNPDLNMLQMDVLYDTDILTCTGITAAPLLTQDGAIFAGNEDNNGKATFAVISTGVVSGNGTMVKLTFRADSSGTSPISLDIVRILSNGNSVSADLIPAKIKVADSTGVPETPENIPDIPAEIPEPEEVPEEIPAEVTFSDVPKNHWAYTYVQNAVKNGLFSGIGNGMFGPAMNVTRGMFVTTLYSSAGSPDVELSNFSDVPANAWYAKAVAWASQQGIVSGIGNNKFGPDLPITREQIALILFNYADGVSPGTELFVRMAYPDAKDIHDWALTAFTWAMNKELISGKSGNILDPLATATRAEVAVIMQNFVNLTK